MSNAPTSARAQFDRQAKQYNGRWANWTDETLQRMLTLSAPQPTWHVLDIATGTGYTALAFAPEVAHVTGADISPGMLTQAAKRAAEQGIENTAWRETPAEALPFLDASFDLVTVRVAPHHFTDVPKFLSETNRVLKANGIFVLGDTTVPDNDPEAADWQNTIERERDPSHFANLSPETWRTLAEAAGFTVTDLESMTGAIKLDLSGWLEVSGCTGDRADRVRQLLRDAPEAARKAFQITTDDDGETRFAWQRVILKGVKG